MVRGATYEIEITITKQDDGTALDLTDATGILVGLYGEGKRIFGKWSLVDKSAEGFGAVEITNAVGGIIKVFVEATDTMKALLKVAKLEVLLSLTNTDFADNLQISIDTNIEIEKVEPSIFEGVSPT